MKKHIILLISAGLFILASCVSNPSYNKNTGMGKGFHRTLTCKSSAKR